MSNSSYYDFLTHLKDQFQDNHFSRMQDKYDMAMSFYLKVNKEYFEGQNSKNICYKIFPNKRSQKLIVIVTGYNESMIKYIENIYDFFHQGYSVAIYDHRGQGYSERLIEESMKGYIDSFKNLVEDLSTFLNKVIIKKFQEHKIILMSHSMGAAITYSSLKKTEKLIDAVIFLSPMFKIILPKNLEYMSYLVAKILVFSRLGQNIASYNSDIKRENSYERNHLTNSKFRYEFWLKKRKHEPQLRLDGPTYKWVYEALKMTYSIRKVKQSFTIPTLLLEASFDKVVDNSVNIEVLKNFSHLQQENFFYAKHELLNEIDYIRENAMKRIFDFIEKQ